MARDYVVSRPDEADAPRIAEIHLAAMDANPLLHAQFPSPESLQSVRRYLEAYTAEQLRSADSGVLVARDPETGAVAAFAKWDSPAHPEDVKLESGDLRYLEGCRREFLDGYAALAEQAKKRCFGDRPCYRTLPSNIFPHLPLVRIGGCVCGEGSIFGPARGSRSADLLPARPGAHGSAG